MDFSKFLTSSNNHNLLSPGVHPRHKSTFKHLLQPAIAIFALSLAACGGGGSDSGVVATDPVADTPTTPVDVTIQAKTVILPGDECATGGISVDSEIICDGKDGLDGITALVLQTVVAPGNSCDNGGLRFDVGLDINDNGTLEAAEVDSTEFLCTVVVDTAGFEAPSVVSAISISNTEILLQFSEPMIPSDIENFNNYSISTVESETQMPIWDAVIANDDNSTVLLSTLSQSSVRYLVTATNVRDVDGNAITKPTIADSTILSSPSSTSFVGTEPSSNSIADSDGDSLPDHTELSGWDITITYGNGTTENRRVTSDPGDPNQADDSAINLAARDTDNDGVPDNEERHGGMDPRQPDSDGDTLTDNQEWNMIYSNPSHQDSDGDGTEDGFEFYSYRTSPVLADTDGDQISDTDEVLGRNRDPRIADLPLHGIVVGEVRLQIDERFTYEDTQGNTVTTDSSSNVTLSHGESASRSTGNLAMEEAILNIEAGQPRDNPVNTFYEIEGTYTNGEIDVTDNSSFVESQRVRDESFAKATELSTTSAVTREIVGARIDVELGLSNEGDVSFSISNVEVTVLQRSRESTSRFVPIATLIANSTLITGEPATFNLGPFTTEHGPILFTSRDVFPNEVDQLMQSPSALVFQISNFDITDEFGRLFTFSNQTARDRTAGIIVDYGDGMIERNMVATALQPDPEGFGGFPGDFVGGFNSNGSPKGIPLDFALQDILGLTKNSTEADGIIAGVDQKADSIASGDDVQLIPPGTNGVGVGSIVISPGQNGVLETTVHSDDIAQVTTGYATSSTCSADSDMPRDICTIDGDCMDPKLSNTGSCSGPEMLSRLGSLSTGDFDRQWLVFTTGEVRAGAEFGSLRLMAGDDLYFAFVQDLDEDGVLARVEFLNGSTDSRADLYDNSSFGLLADFSAGDDSYELLPPTLGADGIFDSKDTDRDGLGDYAEIRVGWKVSGDRGVLQQVFSSPRLADSDGDGLLDPQEQDLRSFCNSSDSRIDALCSFQSEEEVGREDAIAIIAGANGVADSAAASGDEQLVAQGTTGLTYGTPIIGPGDDGIMDTFREDMDEYVSFASISKIPPSSDPTFSDTDLDGLDDFAELTGVNVGKSIIDGGNGIASTLAIGDDIQRAFFGGPVSPGGVVILPGPNGTIESELPIEIAPPDDFVGVNPDGMLFIVCGIQDKGISSLRGDDLYLYEDQDGFNTFTTNGDDFGNICITGHDYIFPGDNGILESVPNNNNISDDYHQLAYRVQTDPLRRDTDSDMIADGLEIEQGGDPTDPDDGAEFLDSDQDGLSDVEESALGWMVTVDNGIPRLVLSNPSRPDSDFDGLPDIAEMILGTDPNKADTDNDGLYDFDEVSGAQFEKFFGFDLRFPNFFIDGSASQQYGTNPSMQDTDEDGLGDWFELIQGYQLLVPGETSLRQVNSSPLQRDTDLDGVNDGVEASGFADATDPDTDGDGRFDGLEKDSLTDPLVKDVGVRVNVNRLIVNNLTDTGQGYEHISTPQGGGNQEDWWGELGWWITVQINQEPIRLVSSVKSYKSTQDATELGMPSIKLPDGRVITIEHKKSGAPEGAIVGTTDCHYLRNIPLTNTVSGTPLSLNIYDSSVLTLKEGDRVTVRGLIAELDGMSTDCGIAPAYIPTIIDSECSIHFEEAFGYDDFVNGGQAVIPSQYVVTQAESCEWDLELEVTSQ
jgi:hypothetical protein